MSEELKSNSRCTLTDAELVEKCTEWVQKLIDTGGRDWCLPVPANPNKDVDLVLCELIQRFKNNAPKADEWVSVETALPEKDGKYLAYVKPGSGLYDEGAHSLIYDSQNGFGRATHKHVTHWQPLPTPPNQ